jgi:transcriptional regulator with XRE-family HTH domain
MQRIRELRAERGLTQVRLAVAADMNPATLNRIEQGKANPNIKTLERLAQALDVGLVDLLAGDSPEAQASLWLEEQLERRDYDFQAARDGLDRFCEHWHRRLSKQDLNRQAFDDLGVTVETWIPILTQTLAAEWNELHAAGKDWNQSVVWPATERFLRLGEDLAAAEHEMYGQDMEAEKRRESFEVLEGMRDTA